MSKNNKTFPTVLALILVVSLFFLISKLACYAESTTCSNSNCLSIGCAGASCTCNCSGGGSVSGTCGSTCNGTCNKDVLCVTPTPTPQPACGDSTTTASCSDRVCTIGTCTSTIVGCRCCPGGSALCPTSTPSPTPPSTPTPTSTPTPSCGDGSPPACNGPCSGSKTCQTGKSGSSCVCCPDSSNPECPPTPTPGCEDSPLGTGFPACFDRPCPPGKMCREVGYACACITPSPTPTPDCRGGHSPPSPGICEGLGSNSAGDGHLIPPSCTGNEVPVGPCCCPQTTPASTATPTPQPPACPPGSTNTCSPNYGCCPAPSGNICKNSTGSNCPTPTPTPTPKPCDSSVVPFCSDGNGSCTPPQSCKTWGSSCKCQ